MLRLWTGSCHGPSGWNTICEWRISCGRSLYLGPCWQHSTFRTFVKAGEDFSNKWLISQINFSGCTENFSQSLASSLGLWHGRCYYSFFDGLALTQILNRPDQSNPLIFLRKYLSALPDLLIVPLHCPSIISWIRFGPQILPLRRLPSAANSSRGNGKLIDNIIRE